MPQWLKALNASDPIFLTREIAEFRAVAPQMVEPLKTVVRHHPPAAVRVIEPWVSRIPPWVPVPLPNVTWYQLRRYHALRALAFAGSDAASALPLLAAVAEENNAALAGAARMAMKAVGPAAIPELIRLVREAPDTVKSEAIQTLGEIGPKAIDALPVLEETLGSSKFMPALMSAFALGRLGPSAGPALERSASHVNPLIRARVLESLAMVAPESERFRVALAEARKSPDSELRRTAEAVVAKLGVSLTSPGGL